MDEPNQSDKNKFLYPRSRYYGQVKHELHSFPNAILIRALQEQWKSKASRSEYLELPRSAIGTGIGGGMAQFLSGGMMCLHRLVLICFIAFGQEFIQFTNGKEILVETAWRWSGNECWNMPVVESVTSAKPSLWKLTQEMRSLNTQTSTEILCYSP
ncbi:hypothetical protein [Nostoc sp.]|uniref:hypothetical protein n=1 Tax=Nostoc sp. TaxID=1180 RepID=UPI002FFB8D12